jgi:4-hydroxysphinganine ceramide fatty acyl 2-hydroxylase
MSVDQSAFDKSAMGKRLISKEEVHQHRTGRSIWVIVDKKGTVNPLISVYDVTEFLFDHPGGEEFILQHGGEDITDVLKDSLEHFHSEAAYSILEQYYIGDLCDKNTSNKQEKNTFVDRDDISDKFIDLKRPILSQVWNGNYSKKFYLHQVHIPRHVKDSAPIFGNKYLEIFTKTPWYVIPMVYIPLISIFVNIALNKVSTFTFTLCYLLGILNWTSIEYFVHRYFFHIESLLPDNRVAITLHFLIHGIHHLLPMDRYILTPPTY